MYSNIYEYMHDLDVVAESEGVDALTITATGLDGKVVITRVLDMVSDTILLDKEKKWGFQGAAGWTRGPVSYATKYSKGGGKLWSIAMIKGPIAHSALAAAVKCADGAVDGAGGVKYTRVDLRADLKMREPRVGLPRIIKDGYKGKYEIKIIESRTGDTLYCGSRESGTFVRIYDKSAAYGEERGSGKIWRFEVEFKMHKVQPVVNALQLGDFRNAGDIIWQTLRGRNIPSPKIGAEVEILGECTNLSSAEQKLDWLARQVSPTTKFLVALGMKKEVKKTLGLFDD